ncbi:hypothetical protein HC891_11670 [Candidatus Gracilibacteria bacterium]|nr:hypothetical protein [Candidatus Gracilibacteria bacterium]
MRRVNNQAKKAAGTAAATIRVRKSASTNTTTIATTTLRLVIGSAGRLSGPVVSPPAKNCQFHSTVASAAAPQSSTVTPTKTTLA